MGRNKNKKNNTQNTENNIQFLSSVSHKLDGESERETILSLMIFNFCFCCFFFWVLIFNLIFFHEKRGRKENEMNETKTKEEEEARSVQHARKTYGKSELWNVERRQWANMEWAAEFEIFCHYYVFFILGRVPALADAWELFFLSFIAIYCIIK